MMLTSSRSERIIINFLADKKLQRLGPDILQVLLKYIVQPATIRTPRYSKSRTRAEIELETFATNYRILMNMCEIGRLIEERNKKNNNNTNS